MERDLKTRLIAAAFALTMLTAPMAFAASAPTNDLTSQLRAAGVNVDDLKALEVGGIVVLRGRTANSQAALDAGFAARSLGYTRVANLIQVIEPVDDVRIERLAERQLGLHRSLEGCNIAVDSDHGVVHLSGTVKHELQKDVAVDVVRNINGVRAVEIGSLKR